MKMSCPFCGLNDVHMETALCNVIRDKYPVSPGHTLIIPKRHVETYFDLSNEEKEDVMRLIDSLKEEMDMAIHPDGYNIGFNAGIHAGQTVMHCHIHVIPRYRGDMDDPRGGVRGVIPSKQSY